MAQHKPGVSWATYMDRYPRVYVDTLDRKHVQVTFFGNDDHGYGFTLDRTHAKLLARRINQCLEDTK